MIFNWSSGPKGPRGAIRMPPCARDTVSSPVNYRPRSGLRLEARRAEMSKSHDTFNPWHGTVSRELQAAKRPATRGPKGWEEQVASHLLPVTRYLLPWITSREAACDSRPIGPRGASRLPSRFPGHVFLAQSGIRKHRTEEHFKIA